MVEPYVYHTRCPYGRARGVSRILFRRFRFGANDGARAIGANDDDVGGSGGLRVPYSLPLRAREADTPSLVSRPTRAKWLSRLGGAAAAG